MDTFPESFTPVSLIHHDKLKEIDSVLIDALLVELNKEFNALTMSWIILQRTTIKKEALIGKRTYSFENEDCIKYDVSFSTEQQKGIMNSLKRMFGGIFFMNIKISFCPDKVKAILQKLYELGYFNDNTTQNYQFTNDCHKLVDITLTCK